MPCHAAAELNWFLRSLVKRWERRTGVIWDEDDEEVLDCAGLWD